MADKQPHLNAAVPLSTILKLVIGIVVVVGLVVLILCLVFRPKNLTFEIIGDELYQFNFTGNQLHYNLALHLIDITNPNKRIGVYYDTIEVSPFYKGHRLESQWLPPFYHPHMTTTILKSQFNSQKLLLLAGQELAEFNAEKLAGFFHVDVKFRLRLRLKIGALRIRKYRSKVNCELKVPFRSSTDAFKVPFQTTRCHFHF